MPVVPFLHESQNLSKCFHQLFQCLKDNFLVSVPCNCRNFSTPVSNLSAYNKLHKVIFLSLFYTLKPGLDPESFECKDYVNYKKFMSLDYKCFHISNFRKLPTLLANSVLSPFFLLFSFFSPSLSLCKQQNILPFFSQTLVL